MKFVGLIYANPKMQKNISIRILVATRKLFRRADLRVPIKLSAVNAMQIMAAITFVDIMGKSAEK